MTMIEVNGPYSSFSRKKASKKRLFEFCFGEHGHGHNLALYITVFLIVFSGYIWSQNKY
jgi:hypothetical protein